MGTRQGLGLEHNKRGGMTATLTDRCLLLLLHKLRQFYCNLDREFKFQIVSQNILVTITTLFLEAHASLVVTLSVCLSVCHTPTLVTG